MSNTDHAWMLRAIELAQLGQGWVEPNPMVGCVIVRDGQLLGEGYHKQFGGAHAERNAIAQAGAIDLRHATAFVSLEPCCHVGKTPACTEALIDAGISRVVVAQRDPFPAVAGKGIEILRRHGIEVEEGVCAKEAESVCAPFFKRVRTGRPWVIGKWAMSLDGRIATRTSDSQWISGPASRRNVHQLRSRVDAVMVGRNTALLDDPSLNARDVPCVREARRVVVDSGACLSASSKLATTASDGSPVLLWVSAEHDKRNARRLRDLGVEVRVCELAEPNERLDALLVHLGTEGATNVLVEGGGELLGSLADIGQLDQCEVFIGPKLIGGRGALAPLGGLGIGALTDSPHVKDLSMKQLGQDVHISCRLERSHLSQDLRA